MSGLHPSRTVGRERPAVAICGTTPGAFSPRWPSCWRTPRRTSWPSRPSQWPAGRAGPARGRGGQSSPTDCRRGVWWVRCWPSSMMSGPKVYATSPSTTPPATRPRRSPIFWNHRPDQHQKGRRAFTPIVCCVCPVNLPICGAGERGASFTNTNG